MERLTFDGDFCDIAMCSSTPGGSFCEDGACSQRRVWERLKAYEDIGLMPEEVKDMAENAETRLLTWFEARYGFSIGKLMDLLEAKQQGRLVELPCKVGDTVYKICPISNFLEIGDMWDGHTVKTDCQRCPYGRCDCHDIGYQKDARNVVVERKMSSLVEIVRCMPYFDTIYFLTREAAETALKERTT